MTRSIPALCLLSFVATVASAFLPSTTLSPARIWRRPGATTTFTLLAKKQSSAGQGFGKVEATPKPAKRTAAATPSPSSSASSSETDASLSPSAPLQSIEKGGSDAIPTIASTQSKDTDIDSMADPSLSPEERAKRVLREKYGLRTLEEQQMDEKQRQRFEERQRQRQEWKKQMDDEKQDFDIMTVLPPSVLIAIDRFLKAGVALCTVLFVSAGFAITAEAWSKASGNPLPADVDAFIVNVIEPNFTPGLLVLLGFSVSLGIFSALQLGSAGATYKEDK